MREEKPAESFPPEETKKRFEAALRGARSAGYKPLKDIAPKREKTAKGKKGEGDK